MALRMAPVSFYLCAGVASLLLGFSIHGARFFFPRVERAARTVSRVMRKVLVFRV